MPVRGRSTGLPCAPRSLWRYRPLDTRGSTDAEHEAGLATSPGSTANVRPGAGKPERPTAPPDSLWREERTKS